jgi:Domain of unknown function (DUF1841)
VPKTSPTAASGPLICPSAGTVGSVADDADARRSFAVPRRAGQLEGIDLDQLNPADPDDRHLLILAGHPELSAAIENNVRELMLHGRTVNPQLHITLHEVVANQLWDDTPHEVWRTAQRLLGRGYDRHAVLHMLASVVSDQLWDALHDHRPIDPERYDLALRKLPESWEATRPAAPFAHRRPTGRTTARTKRRGRPR